VKRDDVGCVEQRQRVGWKMSDEEKGKMRPVDLNRAGNAGEPQLEFSDQQPGAPCHALLTETNSHKVTCTYI